MRLHDGRYECAHCGAFLEIPLVGEPQVVIRAASGEANIRTLMLDGEVIHACEIAKPADNRQTSTL